MKKKRLNKELKMTKRDNEDLENSSQWCVCDNSVIDCGVKVRNHCHITENIEVLHIEIVISMLN